MHVGRDGRILETRVGEYEGVLTAAGVDRLVAGAGNEQIIVVAGSANERLVSAAADERVVAVAANECVVAGATEQIFAVTSVPDEKKGERLMVLHTLPDDELQECLTQLSKSDLPPLWKPRADQFLRVESLPYLGTGKLDLRKLREIAVESTAREEP